MNIEAKTRTKVILSYSAAIILQVLTWFLLYPVAGYNNLTLHIALAAMFMLGITLLLSLKLSKIKIGAGLNDFLKALFGFLAVNLIIIILLLLMRLFGSEKPLFRSNYRLDAFLSNWVLTAFGEELVFIIIFSLLSGRFDQKNRWKIVLIVAGLFAIWHLPGYLAIGIKMDSLNVGIFFDLLLRFISWLFFGFIYLFSGNLWLVVFAHASTDYAILPAVVNQPNIGLLFMGLLLTYAWMLKNRKRNSYQFDAKEMPAFE